MHPHKRIRDQSFGLPRVDRSGSRHKYRQQSSDESFRYRKQSQDAAAMSSPSPFKSRSGYNGKYTELKKAQNYQKRGEIYTPDSPYAKRQQQYTSTTQADVSQHSYVPGGRGRPPKANYPMPADSDQDDPIMGRRLNNQSKSKAIKSFAKYQKEMEAASLPQIGGDDSSTGGRYPSLPKRNTKNKTMNDQSKAREAYYKPPLNQSKNRSELRQMLRSSEYGESQVTPAGNHLFDRSSDRASQSIIRSQDVSHVRKVRRSYVDDDPINEEETRHSQSARISKKWSDLAKRALVLWNQEEACQWAGVALRMRVSNKYTPLENWQRLLLRAMQIRELSISKINAKDIIRSLRQKEDKLRQLRSYGRWRMLTNGILARYNNQRALRNRKRWSRLLKTMEREGLIRLKSLNYISLSQVNSRLSEAKGKKRLLQIYGRWGRLVRGLLSKADESEDIDPEAHLAMMVRKSKSLLNHKRWISLTKKLVQRKEKLRRLHIVSKWRMFARILLEEEGQGNAKLAKLKITGRWLKLTRKILNKDKKLYQLQIHGRWRKLTFALIQQQKVQRLHTLGRWRRLTNKLLRTDEAELITRLRWIRLVKGISQAVPGAFVMKSFEDLRISDVIQRLKIKNEKTRQLRVIGRWRQLTQGLLSGNVVPAPAPKMRAAARPRREQNRKIHTLTVLGKWRVLIAGLRSRQQKIHLLGVNAKWRVFAKRLLQRERLFGQMRISLKWRNFATQLLHRRNLSSAPLQRWKNLLGKMAMRGEVNLSIDIGSMISKLKESQFKKSKMDVLGRWNRLARGLLAKSKQNEFRATTNLARLGRKILAKHRKIHSMKNIGKWRTLAFKLLRSQEGSAPMSMAMLNWANIIQKVQFKIKTTETPSFSVFLNYDKAKASSAIAKQKHLRIMGKWAFLSRKLLDADKDLGSSPISMKNAIAWRRLAWNLIKKDKQRRLKILGRWRRLVKNLTRRKRSRALFVVGRFGQLIRKYTEFRKKQKTMKACARLSKLARKLLEKHKDAEGTRRTARCIQSSKNLPPAYRWAKITNKLLAREKKKKSLEVIGRWNRLISKMIQKDYFSKPLDYTPMERWQVILQKVLRKVRTDTRKACWGSVLKNVKSKYIDYNRKGKQLEILNRWSRLINGSLRRQNKRDSLKIMFVWRRWCRMILQNEKKRVMLVHMKWKRLMRNYLRLQNNRRLFVHGRLSQLVSKYIKYKWRSKQMKVFCRLRMLARKYVTLHENKARLQRAGRLPTLVKRYLVLKKKQNSLQAAAKWKRLANQLLKQNDHKFKEKAVVANWQRVVRKMLNVSPKFITLVQAHHLERLRAAREEPMNDLYKSRADLESRVVNNMDALEREFRGKREQAANLKGNQFSSSQQHLPKSRGATPTRGKRVVKSKSPMRGADPGIDTMREENDELREEVAWLRGQLVDNQTELKQIELDMDSQLKKFGKEVDLARQRENKLMFFLYVLKEEKKCPVSEVFEEYIKPIDTCRFASDYGSDYKKILRKIQKQTKYEKLYSKAVKKIKLIKGNRDYKSDSTLPENVNSFPAESSDPPSEGLGQRFLKKQQKHKKEVEEGKRAEASHKVKIPKKKKVPNLDMMQLGQGNRVFNKGNAIVQNRSGSRDAEGGEVWQESDIDNFNFGTYSSQDSKGKVRDVVLDPIERKRLLDSLGVITTREKWESLQE